MGFIDQEHGIGALTLGKETLQIYMWVKQIVVVADHGVAKQADIQTELKRTYHMPA